MKSKGLYRALTAILAVGVLPVAFTGCGQEKVKESTTTSTVISVVDDGENAGEADAKDESKDESKDDGKTTDELTDILLGKGGDKEKEETGKGYLLMKAVNSANELKMIDDKYRTFYEIFPYSFYDTDGDGIGDLKGICEKLDYINDGNPETDSDLGFTGIWLMPVNTSKTYHKYDVVDYYEIDPEYGSMEDFELLIEEAHKRGIKVIMDFVINHTSSEHEWFKEAESYLKGLDKEAEPDLEKCPYVAYYNFKRTNSTGCTLLSGTNWYYECPFWSEMPDLNLENEAVRAEIEKIAKFYLDKGIDGFRLDAVKEYVSGNDEKNIEILKWFNDYVKSVSPEAYIVGECWLSSSTYAKYYGSGIDSLFDFDFADKSGIIASVAKGTQTASNYVKSQMTLEDSIRSYSESAIDAPFYTNHDMGRSAGYFPGDDALPKVKFAQGLNLLMSGNAFVYYGEEIGMKGTGIDENKRGPMQWGTDEGMCKGPSGMEDIKQKYPDLSVQEKDEGSIYNYVKEAIRLRNTFPALSRGKISIEEDIIALYASDTDKPGEEITDGNVIAYYKKMEDEKDSADDILIVINSGKAAAEIDISMIDNVGMVYSIKGMLSADGGEITLENGILRLPAYGIALLQ